MTSKRDLEHFEWRAKCHRLDCVDAVSEFAPIPPSPREVEPPKISALSQAGQFLQRAANTILGGLPPQKEPQDEPIVEAKYTILQRITSILDHGGRVSADDLDESAFKQFWMPDSNCKQCYECGVKFSTFVRRHHCRICGQIFCANCCNHWMIKKYQSDIDLRVCQYCAGDILNYLRSKTATKTAESTATTELCRYGPTRFREEALWPQSTNQFVVAEFPSETTTGTAKPFDINVFWKRTLEVFPFQNHRLQNLSYPNTATGDSLATWIQAELSIERTAAAAIGQQLIDAGLLETVGEAGVKQFADATVLYRPAGLSADPAAEKESDNADPLWVCEIAQLSRSSSEESLTNEWTKTPCQSRRNTTEANVSALELDLNLRQGFASLLRIHTETKPAPVEQPPATSEWDRTDGGMLTDDDDPAVSEALLASTEQSAGNDNANGISESEMNEIRSCLDAQYAHMEKEMLNQQLVSNGLVQSWADIIIPIVHRVAATVTPPSSNNDIRNLVHVKKIPGGRKKDTSIIWGTAFSKSLVHKEMRRHIEHPKVLILQGAISYQRNESKIDTLEPIVMQEQDYVKYAIAKIRAYQPDILIVEKSVSWLVREKLRELDVSLILNTKKSVMERLAQLTGSSQVISLDALGSPTLGTCERFDVQLFEVGTRQNKSITVFSGCPEHLGCSVLLRGGTPSELSKLKQILKFMIFMNYNWKLEKAFLLNEVALPPMTGTRVAEEEEEEEDTVDVANRPSSPVIQAPVVTIRELTSEAVEDNSDPLRSVDPDKFVVPSPAISGEPLDNERYYTHVQFNNILKNTLLTISPFIKVNPPYMETPQGAACQLRHFLPKELYVSEKLHPPQPMISPMIRMEPASANLLDAEVCSRRPDIEVLQPHPFLAIPATSLSTTRLRDNPKFRALLADYRARGARIKKICKCRLDSNVNQPTDSNNQIATAEVGNQSEEDCSESIPKPDCFSPYNHQQMVVLFFCYSERSKNAPGFCVEPKLLTMHFYANGDITLGRYLEQYCLRPDYACQCGLEMRHHRRNFIHDSGSIVLDTWHRHDRLTDGNQIMIGSFCRKCRNMTNMRTMSKDMYNLSFAKYLELRFYGAAYTYRGATAEPCGHSLHHDHYQYFAAGHMYAALKYVPITVRELVLPPSTIRITAPQLNISAVTDEVRDLSEKSNEFYQAVLQALTSASDQVTGTKHESWLIRMLEMHREQRQKNKNDVDQLNVQLATLADASSEDRCWPIFDSLAQLKTHISDGVQTWNEMLVNFENARKKEERSGSTRKDSNTHKSSNEVTVDGPLDNDSVDHAEVTSDTTKLPDINEEYLNLAIDPSSDEGRTPSATDEKFAARNDDLALSGESKQEKPGVKTIISQFLHSGTATIIQSPFPASEHYSLNLGTEPPIAVYDNEPSSIIAASLASTDYQSTLSRIQTQLALAASQTGDESTNEVDILEMTDFNLPTGAKPERARLHIEVQFHDASTRYYCRIYFAEHFRQIRRLLFPAGEKRFIYSLARCVAWQAQGGKSGSVFCKTLDDRFILKEMSRSEMDGFREEIGLKYFNYISYAAKGKHPTVLGRIVGMYRIGYHNTATNYQSKMDLLVMENLFYERNIVQKFDLKGSERNRLVDDVARNDVVLQDENFVMQMCGNPLYIRQHSKKVLLEAIANDSSFLAECKVMDYSLLVGIDAERNEFVVGIIDYVRRFTWDKKAEMIIKTALPGKPPTVIWPDGYKTRFHAAMERYFLAVPDRWTPLGRDSTYEPEKERTAAS